MQHTVTPTFEQVLEENKARIYRICRAYAVTPIEPQDLFQEVTFQVWTAFSSFENKASIDTWVYRIALNVCMRHQSRLKKVNEKMVCLDSIEFRVSEDTTDHYQEEKHKALSECILELNGLDRSIVILSLEGLSYKKISNITGLTENHIAVKMKRMKKSLLKCITSKLK